MTPLSVTPIALLAGLASDFNATILSQSTHDFVFRLPLPRADGFVRTYEISARSRSSVVSAKETAPTFLPSFCPERHINLDATFCMNWQERDDLSVVDDQTAKRWWSTLVKFLLLQERAHRLRRWPSTKQRAHGDAAKYQQEALVAAEQLGADFSRDIEQGRIRVAFRRIGGFPVLRIFRGNVWTYSVRLDLRRVINLRQRCICARGGEPRPRVLRSCGAHAKAAADLAIAIHEQEKAEKAFWEGMRGKPCCRTMKYCPLA